MSAAGSGPLDVLGLLGLDSGLNVVTAMSGNVGIDDECLDGWRLSMLGATTGPCGLSNEIRCLGDCVMTNSRSCSSDLGLSSEALALFRSICCACDILPVMRVYVTSSLIMKLPGTRALKASSKISNFGSMSWESLCAYDVSSKACLHKST